MAQFLCTALHVALTLRLKSARPLTPHRDLRAKQTKTASRRRRSEAKQTTHTQQHTAPHQNTLTYTRLQPIPQKHLRHVTPTLLSTTSQKPRAQFLVRRRARQRECSRAETNNTHHKHNKTSQHHLQRHSPAHTPILFIHLHHINHQTPQRHHYQKTHVRSSSFSTNTNKRLPTTSAPTKQTTQLKNSTRLR
jgi:hypothetical protein